MKTSVNMIRKLDGHDVEQRTKDGYFDANKLLTQWNKKNRTHDTRVRMDKFLGLSKTKEFIQEIESHGDENTHADNKAVITRKGRNTGEGTTPDRVWMHPYLFIDFAMWINPTFKYKVIQFVYDQLLQTRNDAGDFYKGLTKAIRIFEPSSREYILLAKALNYIAFGKHERNIRQSASQDQLQKLTDIQKQLAFAIDMGYIKSFQELINEMRRIFNKAQ